jgi:hypothetical protein
MPEGIFKEINCMKKIFLCLILFVCLFSVSAEDTDYFILPVWMGSDSWVYLPVSHDATLTLLAATEKQIMLNSEATKAKFSLPFSDPVRYKIQYRFDYTISFMVDLQVMFFPLDTISRGQRIGENYSAQFRNEQILLIADFVWRMYQVNLDDPPSDSEKFLNDLQVYIVDAFSKGESETMYLSKSLPMCIFYNKDINMFYIKILFFK